MKKTSLLFAVFCMALSSCGALEKNDNSANDEQAEKYKEERKACGEKVDFKWTNGECVELSDSEKAERAEEEARNQSEKEAKEFISECEAKGRGWEVLDEECVNTPELELTGAAAAEPGLLWMASRRSCDKKGDRYIGCEGIKLTIPLAKATAEKTLQTVEFHFSCNNLKPLRKSILKIGEHLTDGLWSPSEESNVYTFELKEGEKAEISIEMESTSNVFDVGCKIELIENSVSKPITL